MRACRIVSFAISIVAILVVLPGPSPFSGAWNLYAQEAQPTESEPAVTVVTLEIGRLGAAPRAYEIRRVSDGPPPEEPEYVELDELTLGVSIGILDRQEQVIEVHLFRAAGEPMTQLLIEPGVTGYADTGVGDREQSTAIEVELLSIRQAPPGSGSEVTEAESDQASPSD